MGTFMNNYGSITANAATDQTPARPVEGDLVARLRELTSGVIVGTSLGDSGTEDYVKAFKDGWKSAMSLVAEALSQPSPQREEVQADLDFCNKCGFYGSAKPDGSHLRPKDGEWCNYLAGRAIKTVAPQPAGEVGERAVVAWLRDDADLTEIEARKIILDCHGLKPRDIEDWQNLVATKRGIADAIERGDHRLDLVANQDPAHD